MTDLVAGVVLAAGEGRRFGQPKALVEFVGRPLIERAVWTLAAGGCSTVFAVLGAQADRVLSECDLTDAVVVRNQRWADGMSGSLSAGLVAAEDLGASAAVIALVDQPVIRPNLVERLVRHWHEGSVAVVAAYGGAPRTPVLLDRSIWRDVRESAVGDLGAWAYLRAHPEVVDLVGCDDVGDACDIDDPGDVRAVQEAWYRLQALSAPRL